MKRNERNSWGFHEKTLSHLCGVKNSALRQEKEKAAGEVEAENVAN